MRVRGCQDRWPALHATPALLDVAPVHSRSPWIAVTSIRRSEMPLPAAAVQSANKARVIRRKIIGIRHLFRANRQEVRDRRLERIEHLSW